MPPLLSEGGYHYPEKPEFVELIFVLNYSRTNVDQPVSDISDGQLCSDRIKIKCTFAYNHGNSMVSVIDI